MIRGSSVEKLNGFSAKDGVGQTPPPGAEGNLAPPKLVFEGPRQTNFQSFADRLLQHGPHALSFDAEDPMSPDRYGMSLTGHRLCR
jgi:hypothetical protein